ncbi:hypothetical protein F4604DRAFT_1762842 [Suillus subluteus]|nr:hypothetical protein F4604DRAFT_1762842 [Suillus subluteus]
MTGTFCGHVYIVNLMWVFLVAPHLAVTTWISFRFITTTACAQLNARHMWYLLNWCAALPIRKSLYLEPYFCNLFQLKSSFIISYHASPRDDR